ncbi:MAG: FtsK/SpoIIIE domain protein, partial [Candidatus Nomurabacteria bacterium GW2011_GWB1_37_5]
PTVTRYALKPAEGMKLSRILGLQNDLSLALAAHPLRIEAPIPGKSLVGIEVPNRAKSTVGLATLLGDPKFKESEKPLMVSLGKNIAGRPMFSSLAKMPHALIAGTTGSGKSVTIHAIITSLLYRNSPEDLRMILIDPKRVELTLYNGIPHLLTPVITDPKKAILSLKWATKEMERRYNILEAAKVRDILSYHEKITKAQKHESMKAQGKIEANKQEKKTLEEEMLTASEASKSSESSKSSETDPMPYIVIIIDELADIMTSYPRELESGIVRLAQMSRAVGIHLILSTQRPSVNVITGLIKANIPARIALQVSSQIDSRTILDCSGAEKLLGAGDMLFLSGEMAQPERLQSAFISEEEVKKVVKFIAKNNNNLGDELLGAEMSLTGPLPASGKTIFDVSLEDEGDDDDDLYEDARLAVIEAGKASTSYLQRKLKVGYSRAARLIDMLEERGVVGSGSGAKPREVLEKAIDNVETS